MSERSDEYRNLAKIADEEAQPRIAKIDRRIPDHEILLGLVGHLKVQIFTVAADVLEEIEKIQSLGMSASEKTQARNHRLRIAALRGDQETIDKIIDESVREATSDDA